MTYSWEQLYPAIERAIRTQGFRRIDVQSLPLDVASWPSGGGEIDSALIGVLSLPNWSEIGRQLRLHVENAAFQRLYVRRDRHDLEIIVEQAWSRGLSLERAERELEHAWHVHERISPLLDRFELSDGLKAQMQAALQQTEGGTAASTRVAAAQMALRFAADLSSVSAATGTLLMVGTDGVKDELARRLGGSRPMMHRDKMVLGLVAPSISLAVIDAPAGVGMANTGLGSIHVEQLIADMRHLAAGG